MDREQIAELYERMHKHLSLRLGLVSGAYRRTHREYQDLLLKMRLSSLCGASIRADDYLWMIHIQAKVGRLSETYRLRQQDFDQLQDMLASMLARPELEFEFIVDDKGDWKFGLKNSDASEPAPEPEPVVYEILMKDNSDGENEHPTILEGTFDACMAKLRELEESEDPWHICYLAASTPCPREGGACPYFNEDMDRFTDVCAESEIVSSELEKDGVTYWYVIRRKRQ